MMSKFLIILALLIGPLTVFSQVELGECDQPHDGKADQQVAKALKAINAGDLKMANIYAKNILDIEPQSAHGFYLLGELGVRERNIRKAEAYWVQLMNVCPDYKADVQYFLGVILIENGKKKQGEELIEKFLQNPERDRGYDKEAKLALEESRLVAKLLANPVPFDPKPVKMVSTKADEYLAIISPDQELCFFTRRSVKRNKYGGPTEKAREVEEFTLAHDLGNGFDEGEALPSPFNQNYNEGGPTITADNRELYFTVCKMQPEGYKNCDIYTSRYENGFWTPIEPLGDHINAPDSWESQPSISANGDHLYFASNRKGGEGGLDIYVSHRKPDGSWTAPENLGKSINTYKDEKSPFIHSDSQTLYFSSMGHATLGGFDIYYSKQNTDKTWEKPVNIGYPINTEADELGLFVSLDGSTAYFNSNKLRGMGGWDLYSFELHPAARPEKVALVKGTLLDENNNVAHGAEVEIKNLQTKEIQRVKVDESTGKFAAVVQVKENQDVMVKVKKNGTAFSSKFIDSKDNSTNGVHMAELEVAPLTVGREYRLNDIQFPTNSFELTPQAQAIVDEFLLFLEDNPRVKVDIQGHTDDVGKDEDNLLLSKNRAQRVYDYLVSKGISPSRMSHHGYGETRPLADNQIEEGRAKNRRTVFVITSK